MNDLICHRFPLNRVRREEPAPGELWQMVNNDLVEFKAPALIEVSNYDATRQVVYGERCFGAPAGRGLKVAKVFQYSPLDPGTFI